MDKAPGHPTVLTKEEENILCEHIMLVAEWGYPMTQTLEAVKHFFYLDKKGVANSTFRDNLPGTDWANKFLQRHKDRLSTRLANNIKWAKASIGPDVM
uniref:HTH CENPB-type domain-containing protein n=1 Tax=Romanomermis culicivorax TaxID=13658 RepID=A0A915ICN1_ROMCU